MALYCLPKVHPVIKSLNTLLFPFEVLNARKRGLKIGDELRTPILRVDEGIMEIQVMKSTDLANPDRLMVDGIVDPEGTAPMPFIGQDGTSARRTLNQAAPSVFGRVYPDRDRFYVSLILEGNEVPDRIVLDVFLVWYHQRFFLPSLKRLKPL
jgi:hypothetical protein